MQIHRGRLWGVGVVGVLYVILLIADALQTNWQDSLLRVVFGFSQLIGILYLVVGTFVWLSGRNRPVSFFLLAGSTCMAWAFSLETAALLVGWTPWSALANSSAQLALYCFALLFLLFPTNYFFSHSRATGFLYGYVVLLSSLAICGFLKQVLGLTSRLPAWFNLVSLLYDVVVVAGILLTMLLSTFSQSTIREREQRRILFAGVVLSFGPLLVLTILPATIANMPIGGIDPNTPLAPIFFALLPLALGYSILRYQLLVFDTAIRRATSWIVSCTICAFLFSVVYLIAISLLAAIQTFFLYIGSALVLASTLLITRIAQHISSRIFAETLKIYQVIEQEVHGITLDESSPGVLARQLEKTVIQLLEVKKVGLLLFDEETQAYHLTPTQERDRQQELLLVQVTKGLASTEAGAGWLARQSEFARKLERSRRPHYLGELSGSAPRDLLLAPLFGRESMIAILLLAKQQDRDPSRLPFASPELDWLKIILDRFAPAFERQMAQERFARHLALGSHLWHELNMLSLSPTSSEQQVLMACAHLLAQSFPAATVEIWMNEDSKFVWVSTIGSGPSWLGSQVTQLRADLPSLHQAIFNDHMIAQHLLPALPTSQSWAWLPLRSDEKLEPRAALVLVFPFPRQFVRGEQLVLQRAVQRCELLLHHHQHLVSLQKRSSPPDPSFPLDVNQDQLTQLHEAIRAARAGHLSLPTISSLSRAFALPAPTQGMRLPVPLALGTVHNALALIVDQHPLECSFLVRLLKRAGYRQVLAAHSAREAVDLVEQACLTATIRATLLLDEWSVPQVAHVLRKLQEVCLWQWEPIIVLTRPSLAHEKKDSIPQGIVQIPKPFSIDEISIYL